MVFRVILPEHSVIARPFINLTISATCNGDILSSIIISAPASSASKTSSFDSVSTSIFLTNEEFFLANLIASFILPAYPIWLSFIKTPSDKEKR